MLPNNLEISENSEQNQFNEPALLCIANIINLHVEVLDNGTKNYFYGIQNLEQYKPTLKDFLFARTVLDKFIIENF